MKDRDGQPITDESFEVMLTAPKFELRHKGYCVEPSIENRREIELRIEMFPKLVHELRTIYRYLDETGAGKDKNRGEPEFEMMDSIKHLLITLDSSRKSGE